MKNTIRIRCKLLGVGFMLLCAWCSSILAQTPQTGLHYFIVQDLATKQIVRRGEAGSNGVAFDNLTLAPNTSYRAWLLQAATLNIAFTDFTTGAPGSRTEPSEFNLRLSTAPDSDNDGLHDDAEFIMGTLVTEPDSDGDGILDGAEVIQGTNPLDGKAVRTGIIASVDTPGTAVAVCAQNDMVAVADSDRGVSVFNVFNGMQPVLIAQVDTPGNAIDVACAGERILVADDVAGLAVIDLSDPPSAHIERQPVFDSAVTRVETVGNLALLGLANGHVISVDLVTGLVFHDFALSTAAIHDLVVGGDILYVQVRNTIYVVEFIGNKMRLVTSVNSPGISTGAQTPRLFAAVDVLYSVQPTGYNTFDLANPLAPVFIAGGFTGQVDWKHIVTNGSGSGIAAVAQDSSGPHEVSLYNVSDPTQNNDFIVDFATPGKAVDIALYNGLAYVADGEAGLQVINYLSYDQFGVPPVINLSASFSLSAAEVEESKRVFVNATLQDDVQARNVEYFLNGVSVTTDGNFPFEYSFVTPRLVDMNTFTIRARATDTGGNTSWSQENTINLLPDSTPPEVISVTPRADGIFVPDSIKAYSVTFSEPMDQQNITADHFQLFAAGNDDVTGTEDDVLIAIDTFSYREDSQTVILELSNVLLANKYQVIVRAPQSDLSGNSLETDFSWTFTVFNGDISSGGSFNGSGNLSESGVIDVYTFTAAPGQSLYFDAQGASLFTINWQLLDSEGSVIFTRFTFSDIGPILLELGGSYTLKVFADGDGTSTYQFQVFDVPPADTFSINIGDVVSDGVPGTGAGNIESPGVMDIYTFTATPGQTVNFDAQGSSANSAFVDWILTDSNDTVLFKTFSFTDVNATVLELGGTYTLTVLGEGASTSLYQFQLTDIAP